MCMCRSSPVTDKTMKWPSRCVGPAAVRSGCGFSVRPRASAWPASARAWSGQPRTTGTSASPRKYRNIGLAHLWQPWAGEWLASMGEIISRVTNLKNNRVDMACIPTYRELLRSSILNSIFEAKPEGNCAFTRFYSTFFGYSGLST